MYPSYHSMFHYTNALDGGKKGGTVSPPKPRIGNTPSAPINIPPKKPRTK